MNFDPARKGIDYAINLYNNLINSNKFKLNIKKDKISAKGLRTRARSFPQLLSSTGLIPSVAFALSKVEDRQLISDAWEALKETGTHNDLSKLIEDIKKEGGGYPVIVALIALIANETQKCEINQTEIDISLAKCLVEKLNSKDILILEKTVISTLQEFKKMAEALFTG